MLSKTEELIRLTRGGIAGTNYLYYTDFSLTEDPISEGGIWLNGQLDSNNGGWSNVQTGSGNAYGSRLVGEAGVSRYGDPVAHLKTSFIDFNADQWCEGVVHRVPGYSNPTDGHEIELLVRWQITDGNIRGYEVLWGDEGEIVLVRWNGAVGSYAALGAALQGNSEANKAVDGDVLRLEIAATTLSVYKNGNLLGTRTDATFADGQPGIGFWPTGGSTLASYGWKSWKAGNL